MTPHPIGDLAFLSDVHSAALIDCAGTVAWLSFPRFDSPSVFTSPSVRKLVTGRSVPLGTLR